MNENLPLHVDGADFSTFGKPTAARQIQPAKKRPKKSYFKSNFGFLGMRISLIRNLFFRMLSAGFPHDFPHICG